MIQGGEGLEMLKGKEIVAPAVIDEVVEDKA